MSLVLQLKQKLQLQLLQELKLELKLQLLKPVLTLIPPEFEGYINIEEDADVELLMESLPFLVLHEYSHPLQDAGRLAVPEYKHSMALNTTTDQELYHDANETGIDKGSILVGVHVE